LISYNEYEEDYKPIRRMKMRRDIKILMHTHWDREWYFTKDETQVLLRNHMQEVIEFLEENQDAIYILDGQSVMIDDFLEFAPEWENRLKAVVESKQLRVGPWYTQTDLLIVHGESIIRNLYYGMKRAMELGEVMKVGYAPDTFGHSSQMPQIYKQFGIESTFFWRGFSELKAAKSDFIWKGIDGSCIYGINLATGYQGAKYLEKDFDDLKVRMEKIMKVLDNYSAGDARLVMNGHDQMPVQKDIHLIMKHLKEMYPEGKVSVSDFESYVDSLRSCELEVVEGELTHSKHSRIHRTINSTRMDIKLLNTEIEYKLYNILEPLAILASKLNLDYPHELFAKCYKMLFGVHAHDSIGGCNSDTVNQDIKQRLINVKEIVDTQIELYMRLISLANKHREEKTITVYNFLPYLRKNEFVEIEMLTRTSNFTIYDEKQNPMEHVLLEQEIVDAGLIDRQVAARLLDIKVYKSRIKLKVDKIDGLSIRYLSYKEIESHRLQVTNAEKFIENEFYKLEVQDNILVLCNKETGAIIKNVISIENSGDAGDSYDYSPPHKDLLINHLNAEVSKVLTIKSRQLEELKYQLNYVVPNNLQKRAESRENLKISFEVKLTLQQKDSKVYVQLKHINMAKDTRYRLVFNTDIVSDIVETDSHLCVVKKPVYLHRELEVWEKEKWVEKPVSIETFQSYISLENEKRQATIFASGLKEYEVVGKNIYVTLFRSFSHLGKRELINRPGRPSGIEIETPDNQMQNQKFIFNFTFTFNKVKSSKSFEAKEFLTPLAGYQLKEFNRFNINAPKVLSQVKESLNLDLKGCAVSAMKLTEKTNNLFIRMFNPLEEPVLLEFNEEAYLATPMEEQLEKITNYTIKPQEILNIIIKKAGS
jgi:mannosylglycerate hydrolase